MWKKVMKKALGVIFFTSWIICGCSVETVFESPRSAVVAIVTAGVAILAAYMMGKGE